VNKDWFDPKIIPIISKLLESDYNNIVNSMKLLNEAKDLKNIEIVTRREAELLLETWMDPSFILKMKSYMK
jgi:hypothetical protein